MSNLAYEKLSRMTGMSVNDISLGYKFREECGRREQETANGKTRPVDMLKSDIRSARAIIDHYNSILTGDES